MKVTPTKRAQIGLILKECKIGELQHVWATWELAARKRIEQVLSRKKQKVGADTFRVRFVHSGRDIREGRGGERGTADALHKRLGMACRDGFVTSCLVLLVLTVQWIVGRRLSAWCYPRLVSMVLVYKILVLEGVLRRHNPT